jgi:hypothetical protein
MEFYQVTQNRAAQTLAVIKQHDPGLTVGGIDIAGLSAQADALEQLAQQRDHALAAYDAANNAEHQGFLDLQRLVTALPKAAEAELGDHTEAESALLDLLSAVYAIKRGQTVLSLRLRSG